MRRDVVDRLAQPAERAVSSHDYGENLANTIHLSHRRAGNITPLHLPIDQICLHAIRRIHFRLPRNAAFGLLLIMPALNRTEQERAPPTPRGR